MPKKVPFRNKIALNVLLNPSMKITSEPEVPSSKIKFRDTVDKTK